MILDFDPIKLTILLLGFLCILALAGFVSRTPKQRIMIMLVLGGFFLFSGLATADSEVPLGLLGAYFAFSLSLIFGFVLGLSMFRRVGITVGNHARPAFEKMLQNGVWRWIIIVFMLLNTIQLVTPEFKLHLLLNPPPPDIGSWFRARFETGNDNIITSVAWYLEILMIPFFYFALYGLRKNIILIAIILFGLLYMEYVANAYIGRYPVFITMLLIGMIVWFEKPNIRSVMVVASVVLLPTLLMVFHVYSRFRLGVPLSEISGEGAVMGLLDAEFSLLKTIGLHILESGQHANLSQYFTWILTLPIPGPLKSGLDVALINFEMSEIYLGVPVGHSNFYAVLPTPLVASFYLYGDFFFWLHGVFVGTIIGFFVRLFERVPALSILYFFIVVMFLFRFNRAGVGSILPSVVNEFLLFYLFLGFAMYRSQTTVRALQQRWGTHTGQRSPDTQTNRTNS